MDGRAVADLVMLVLNGAGLNMSAAGLSKEDLIQIVANARATITPRDVAGWTTRDLVQIAANGKGRVIFSDEE